jgi:hypothetical protein
VTIPIPRKFISFSLGKSSFWSVLLLTVSAQFRGFRRFTRFVGSVVGPPHLRCGPSLLLVRVGNIIATSPRSQERFSLVLLFFNFPAWPVLVLSDTHVCYLLRVRRLDAHSSRKHEPREESALPGGKQKGATASAAPHLDHRSLSSSPGSVVPAVQEMPPLSGNE